MGEEFWEIAKPFLNQTARKITHGEQYPVFLAVMLKINFQVERRDCVTCVGDGQAALRKLYYKQFPMKDQEYILKDLKVPFEGVAYTRENITDAIAKKMLKTYPEFIKLFEKIPAAKPKPRKKKPSSISEN